MSNSRRWRLAVGLTCGLLLAARAVAAEDGFHPEVSVKRPTRLDWRFAVSAFGRGADRVAGAYDSREQRYQLFVPPEYKATKLWPLVVFLSPGDDPLGWRYWQKVCEDKGVFFCAAFGAGNNCPVGRRARIVLDMLDDVRREYHIDPDRTYLSGFSGGSRMACTLAFALPEYFGGVMPVCGTSPLHPLAYLRHRVRDRLSVAFVTGATDFNRRESEVYQYPIFKDLGIRSKLWVVKSIGHAMPSAEVLGEALDWLEEDLPRRQRDVKERPSLAASPGEVATDRVQAARLVLTAQTMLREGDRVAEAVALLDGVLARWEKTEPGERARKLLADVLTDRDRARLLKEQRAAEEQRTLRAQARALERFGERRAALHAYELLARSLRDSPEGKKAEEEVKRLTAALKSAPYLGVSFEGDSPTVRTVVPRSPAARAGLKAGDRVVKVAGAAVLSATDVRRALEARKPGDKLPVEVWRAGRAVALTAEVGKPPEPD